MKSAKILEVITNSARGMELDPQQRLIGRLVLKNNLAVKLEERILIVTDRDKRFPEAEIFFAAAGEYTPQVTMMVTTTATENAQEPPREVAQALQQADIALLVTTFSLSHTKARKEATLKGVRIASMPGITYEMMQRTLPIDYSEIAQRSKAVASILTAGKRALLTSPNGTDAVFDLSGRTGIADTGYIHNPGDFDNLPAGEAFIAPLEGKSEGVVVFDGCFADIVLDQPIKILIERGVVVDISGGEAARILTTKLAKVGKRGYAIAELGVGTNQMARLASGSVLEVEKVFATVHVAIGNNATIGGEVDVPFHSDGVILKPTLKVDGTYILRNGKFSL